MEETKLPGTPTHQAVLSALTAHYANDSRVLAFSLFGSLARGDWDEYSDLDLDVILRDHMTIDARQEVERLVSVLETVGEGITLIVPRSEGSIDLVLLPLLEISIRYHSLATTSPNIVESVVVLDELIRQHLGKLPICFLRSSGVVRCVHHIGPAKERMPDPGREEATKA